MPSEKEKMTMDQKIFEMGLPVETVSVYLMCTGLADTGSDLNLETMMSVWTGSEAALMDGLKQLEEKGIICRDKAADNGKGVFEIASSETWK